MKRLTGMLAGVSLLAMGVGLARAELIQFVNPGAPTMNCDAACQSFVDFGGLGFGADPRLLTLQTAPEQTGSVTPSATGPVVHGDAISGADKAATPTLSALGWAAGNEVAIGYNSNQTGNSGITLDMLTLNVYNSTNTLITSFSTSGLIQYSKDDLALQQGNGNGLFIFKLDATQQALWNADNFASGDTIGLFADMGCTGTPSATCQPSNDGPDSFLAIDAGQPVINPVIAPTPLPAALPMFVGGLGLLGLIGRRKQKAPASIFA